MTISLHKSYEFKHLDISPVASPSQDRISELCSTCLITSSFNGDFCIYSKASKIIMGGCNHNFPLTTLWEMLVWCMSKIWNYSLRQCDLIKSMKSSWVNAEACNSYFKHMLQNAHCLVSFFQLS
jgi:hypothetical protein